jgi:hypothetical protein
MMITSSVIPGNSYKNFFTLESFNVSKRERVPNYVIKLASTSLSRSLGKK